MRTARQERAVALTASAMDVANAMQRTQRASAMQIKLVKLAI